MAYENTVESFINEYAVGYSTRKGRDMTDMHKHLLGAAYQMASLRDALAVARQGFVSTKTVSLRRVRNT